MEQVNRGSRTQTRRPVLRQPRRVNDDSGGTWEWKQDYYDDLTLWSAILETCPWRIGDPLQFLWLPIVKIRVERLQDITVADMEAEGIDIASHMPLVPLPSLDVDKLALEIGRRLCQELWDNIYAKRGYSWETNPHVWVLETEATCKS